MVLLWSIVEYWQQLFYIPSSSPHGSRLVKTELWSFFSGGHRPRESKWTTASYLILGAFSSFFLFLFSLFILASQWVMLQCWQMICPGITSTWAKKKQKKTNIDCILVSRIISAVKRKLVILWWKWPIASQLCRSLTLVWLLLFSC